MWRKNTVVSDTATRIFYQISDRRLFVGIAGREDLIAVVAIEDHY